TASFVAIDVDTGELKWYHQVVPADEWDMDQLGIPMVTDIELDGQTRHVALLPTTTGYLVVLDAETGEFIAGYQKHPEVTVHLGYEPDGTPIINDEVRYTEEGQTHRLCPGLRWTRFGNPAYSPVTGLYYMMNNHQCTHMTMY